MPSRRPTVRSAANSPVMERVRDSAQSIVSREITKELFVAIVAPAGAGAGAAARVIKGLLEVTKNGVDNYEVEVVKASDVIKAWAIREGHAIPVGQSERGNKSIEDVTAMQDLGDRMRHDLKDNSAVAIGLVQAIRSARARMSGLQEGQLDGKPRAYVIDSLRHPTEVALLRRLYQDSFVLIGVVCEPEIRKERLLQQYFKPQARDATAKMAVEELMSRDSDAPQKHGQHVTDTFHEADLFVDNSARGSEDLRETGMNDPIERFIDLITNAKVVRPTIAETAMHHAYSAQLRSSCMSRQVGAALIDENGNVVATGTNEVPRAGGGVYGESIDQEPQAGISLPEHDVRCVYADAHPYCRNNVEQNSIIDELIKAFPALLEAEDRETVVDKIRRTSVGSLIEFSRAVHAEMDAILSASRVGVSPRGKRLFVSTFPCHYCARHIVSAGIDEVQYIEPYPKSRALRLHGDSIATNRNGWTAPSRAMAGAPVDRHPMAPASADDSGRLPSALPSARNSRRTLFHPFTGVSPRMYEKAFLKDRSLKNKRTGMFEPGRPDWGATSSIFSIGYPEMEARLTDGLEGTGP